MLRVGFEQAKSVHASDRAATVIGITCEIWCELYHEHIYISCIKLYF
jgi:hypothetical protein